MGLLDALRRKTYEGLGTSPLYVLFQKDEGWAQMHRTNFEKYLIYRGHKLNSDVSDALKVAIRVNASMTYSEFVDNFLD